MYSCDFTVIYHVYASPRSTNTFDYNWCPQDLRCSEIDCSVSSKLWLKHAMTCCVIGQPEHLYKPVEKCVVSPADGELCIQWYQPSLEEGDTSKASTSSQENKHILLLYAINSIKGDRTSTSIRWVTMPHLLDLHDRYPKLAYIKRDLTEYHRNGQNIIGC